MSLKKTVLAVLTAMTMTIPASMNYMSVTVSADASICTAYTKTYSSELSVSGNTASCKSVVTGYSGKTTKIFINQVLEKKNSSGKWGYYNSTSKSSNSSSVKLEKTYSNVPKGTYRVKTTATVYAGNKSEVVTRYSPTRTIN